MSLSVDGVWKAGVWATTVWADGVWSEGVVQPQVQTPFVGGWPSYGYGKRRRPVEEIEEKIDAKESEIEDREARLLKEKAEQDRLETKAKQSRRDRDRLEALKAEIAKDIQVIMEMRKIYDDLLTLRYLEAAEEHKRKKRNQFIALMMEA